MSESKKIEPYPAMATHVVIGMQICHILGARAVIIGLVNKAFRGGNVGVDLYVVGWMGKAYQGENMYIAVDTISAIAGDHEILFDPTPIIHHDENDTTPKPPPHSNNGGNLEVTL